MARPTGFEPVTSGFVDQRSIRAELRARSFGSLTTLLKHTPIVDLPGVSIRKVFQGMKRRESTKKFKHEVEWSKDPKPGEGWSTFAVKPEEPSCAAAGPWESPPPSRHPG